MSLKGFHVVFVLASISLAVLVAWWSMTTPAAVAESSWYSAMGIFFILAAVGLVGYLAYFLRRFRAFSSM